MVLLKPPKRGIRLEPVSGHCGHRGGIGSQLTAILDAYPSCRGILFDQPSVVAQAPVREQMQSVGGDFFRSALPEADAYLLRLVIHDWEDAEASKILSNLRKAVKPESCIAMIEIVIPETPEFSAGKWNDLVMMLTTGGRERSSTEYSNLLSAAGFELKTILPTASPASLIVAEPC